MQKSFGEKKIKNLLKQKNKMFESGKEKQKDNSVPLQS